MVNMPSVMTSSQHFAQIPRAEIPRSSFDRSHGYKTTFNSGYLVPIFVDEALPGDTFSLNMTGFSRLATPLHPFMDNVFMNTFFFAVPIRLVWDNWEKFNGAQENPGDSTDFLTPSIVAPPGGFTNGSLFDYFGLPTGINNIETVAFYARAYNLIWNEWFRDQNLQDSLEVPKGDGPDLASLYTLKRRGKRHDYFTSCLPWPQKGDSVDIPLGQYAPVVTSSTPIITGVQPAMTGRLTTGVIPGGGHQVSIGGTGQFFVDAQGSGASAGTLYPDNLQADLSEATAATINQLRQAFQVQKLLERDARGGTRYTEVVRSHFGVISPDARLQRPEYLGGGQSPVNLHAVAQTSSTDATSPQGNLSAYGTSVLSGHGFSKSFTEHCVIIGLVSVRADLNYQQGINRMFSRKTRWDYYWPALSHIGEQAVLNQEIYAQGTAVDDEVFGYQERYAEYRYKPSVITGQMRSNFAQSLDTWHLAQDFESLPALNASFIEDNPPISRVIAVPSSPQFIFDGYFNLRCARPMPVYSVPGFIDHF